MTTPTTSAPLPGMAPAPWVTQAELARALGVNRSTINRAAAAGRLVPAGDPVAAQHGLLDKDASIARFQATRGHRTDLVERHAAARATSHQDATQAAPAPQGQAMAPVTPGAAVLGALEAPADATADATAITGVSASPAGGVSALDRAEVKRLILAAENSLTKLRIDLDRGIRLLKADIGHQAYSLGARHVDHLMRIVDQLAARLAAVPDPAERRRLLHPEIHRVRRIYDRSGLEALRALKRDAKDRRPRSDAP